MTADTPVWVCAYANNKWALGGDITEDPRQSEFAKAMRIAKGRTISILDEEGTVFSRIWCMFQIFLTLMSSKGAMAEENSKNGFLSVYTTHTHIYRETDNSEEEERKAVGIILGGSTSDLGIFERICTRETSFPFKLIKKVLSIYVEKANASYEPDRIHILNALLGNTGDRINDNPPATHEKYVELNNKFWGSFASSATALQHAAREGGEGWIKMIEAFANGGMEGELRFNFNSNGVFGELTAAQATQLVAHLPPTIESLIIAEANYGVEFLEALIERVKQLHDMKELTIENTLVGGDGGGQQVGLRLAEILSTNTTIERLHLWNTDLIGTENVEQWGDALMKNDTMTELNLKLIGYA